ncbi:glutamyl-tRNA reductase [Methanocalculus sp.]|uniref:glutamyl-tRNA reductase n=1 Tax=Methanocalculus sp. TaxID=2004547 RepID=UPI0027214E9A|nr:glutamyl-tRNA reductase [Methanocalculus sp.]MDO8842089.1 glutamyl-tRNA reductase [Methanocalculus sp.]
MSDRLLTTIAIAGLDHHTASLRDLEGFRFPDEEEFIRMARTRYKGVLLLQTCNRVEVLVQGDPDDLARFMQSLGRNTFTIHHGLGALRHLLSLAAGIDSMIVGEDQILGQLRKALLSSTGCGGNSQTIDICINTAIHFGVMVRQKTMINRGSVSIGSAAVKLAEDLLGTLKKRHILIVGTGEMGRLVTKALREKDLTAIYVTNRTYERAVELADEIGGKAVTFKDLYPFIMLSDVVISCTAAPHPVIHQKELTQTMQGRMWPLDTKPKPLIIIDIAQPRDTDDTIREIPGVHLFTIDDLRSISEENLLARQNEAENIRELIEMELDTFIQRINRVAANDTIAVLHTWAESIRIRERDKAINRLGTGDPKTIQIIDDLTRVLTNKILADATMAVRVSAERCDLETAGMIVSAITKGEKICFQKHD